MFRFLSNRIISTRTACLRLVCAGLVLLGLSVCASFLPEQTKQPNIQVIDLTGGEISYTGRGAAAGPMLMSSLGASGIAVGLAIDVGIGKDIKSAMDKSGISPSIEIEQALGIAFEKHCAPSMEDAQRLNFLCYSKDILVELDSLHFKSKVGKGDPTVLFINGSIATENGQYEFDKSSRTAIVLDEIKDKGHETSNLFEEVANQMILFEKIE